MRSERRAIPAGREFVGLGPIFPVVKSKTDDGAARARVVYWSGLTPSLGVIQVPSCSRSAWRYPRKLIPEPQPAMIWFWGAGVNR